MPSAPAALVGGIGPCVLANDREQGRACSIAFAEAATASESRARARACDRSEIERRRASKLGQAIGPYVRQQVQARRESVYRRKKPGQIEAPTAEYSKLEEQVYKPLLRPAQVRGRASNSSFAVEQRGSSSLSAAQLELHTSGYALMNNPVVPMLALHMLLVKQPSQAELARERFLS